MLIPKHCKQSLGRSIHHKINYGWSHTKQYLSQVKTLLMGHYTFYNHFLFYRCSIKLVGKVIYDLQQSNAVRQ
jgi:hypothetical protein